MAAFTTSSTPAPIRVHVEYQFDAQGSVVAAGSAEALSIIQAASMAVGGLQWAMKVKRPVAGQLVVDAGAVFPGSDYDLEGMLSPAEPNPAHVTGGAGVAADFILYVTASSAYCSAGDGTLAYALPAALDDASDRPLMGTANLCPDGVSFLSSAGGLQATVDTLAHELLHALARPPYARAQLSRADGSPACLRPPPPPFIAAVRRPPAAGAKQC